ncbi:MAG: biosynthetic-type acetolactate synthase large subunit [Lachnospiraceae bacterium]|nr:biosynthetic-type acetolactate synthase large subunit [Lachnospiraceae bacterium]
MRAQKITGARIVIETLIEQGITDVFGYPGSQVLDIYDELYKCSDRLHHFMTAHEQGAAHAADGYSRATGKIGVVIATSGPGATNLVTGIATAMLDSIPMVAITGNVATSMIGRDSFQEINITGITMPITKHNYFVSDVNELADTIREAFRIAKSGRPGPVLIDIPKDVQVSECEFTPQGVVSCFEQQKADDELIDEAVALLNEAERPYIYIGGGAAGAGLSRNITALAEKIDAYVGCTFMGLSVLPTNYERFLGMQGMHGLYASSMANREADVILGVGVRFSDRATGNLENYAPNARIIQLDTDLAEINKNVPVDIGIIGDITSSFTRIMERCEKRFHPDWTEQVNVYKAKGREIRRIAEDTSGSGISPKTLFDHINKVKNESTIITTDVGQHQMWTAQYINLDRPRRFASSGGLGTMGYGLGASIGAHIATGDRVILITGDGSFGMNLTELATAVTYNIPVTVIILNNRVLGLVHQWQTYFYDKRYSCTTLNSRKTDFVKIAEAFGLPGRKAATIDEFRAAFDEGYAHDGPFLIDVTIDSDELVLPMLPPNGTADDFITLRSDDLI